MGGHGSCQASQVIGKWVDIESAFFWCADHCGRADGINHFAVGWDAGSVFDRKGTIFRLTQVDALGAKPSSTIDQELVDKK
jgi:hypothetical protein